MRVQNLPPPEKHLLDAATVSDIASARAHLRFMTAALSGGSTFSQKQEHHQRARSNRSMEGARPSSVRIGCSEALHHGGGSRTAHAQNLSPDGMVASVPVDAANSRREGKAIGPGSCIRGGDDGEHGSNVYQGVPSKFRGKRRRDTDEAGHLAGASSSTPSGTRKAGHRGVDQYGTQQQQQQQQQCMLPLPRGGDFSSGGVVLPDDSCRHCSANHDERMRRCTGAAAKANPGCTSAASTRGDCSSSCTVGRFHGQALPECGRISPDTTTAQEPGSSRRTGDISATITLSGRNPFPPPGAAASDRRQKPGTAGVEATTTTRCASSTPWDAHVSMPSSSDQETTTVHATDIASVLKLDHGARSDAAMSTARLDEAATTVGDAGQRGKLKKALVGVLTFESLREGALALSSLFLKDETGSVRLICVPRPPPTWLGKVVCLSQWTWTVEQKSSKDRSGFRVTRRLSSPHPSLRPSSFSACLEVEEMTLWQGAVTSGDDSHHDRCWSAVGTGAVSDAHPGRYSTNTATPTLSLSEAYASGAMGLEAFVGQRGRGPVDVVARVAAVSPVIRFKDASPFFMLELEQAEQEQERQAHHAFAYPSTGSNHLSAEPEPNWAADSSSNSNSKTKTSTSAEGSKLTHTGIADEREDCVHGTEGVKISPSLFKQGGSIRCNTQEGGQAQQQQQQQQLMAKMVLNGRRCLPWQACIVPGKTYVFPAVGAIVLGGRRAGQAMYRAFGDALGGEKGDATLVNPHITEVIAGPASHYPQSNRGTTVAEKTSFSGHRAGETAECPAVLETVVDRKLVPAREEEEAKQVDESESRRGCHDERREVGGRAGSQAGSGSGCEGDDGGARGRCECVMTYEGEITGLASQTGTYTLDGNREELGIKLYLQHFHCSLLGAGLRRGALVRIHHVHPVYLLEKLHGLGACLRTTIEILRFSPHGAGAWYRPLVGGPNPFPLVVHAWKHTFSSAFLRKEIPATVAQVAVPEKGKHGSIRSRVDLPEDVEDAERTLIQRVRISKDLQDSKDIEHAVRDSSHPPSFEEVLSQDAGSSSSSSAAAVSSSLSSSSSEIRQQDTRSTDEDPQDKRSVAKTRPPSKGARTACTTAARLAGQLNNPVSTIKTRGEEGGVRGVGGSGEGDLRKKHDKAFPVEWSFSKWAARVTKWAFGDGMALPKRDVYAEFLNHPAGVCEIVDPRSGECWFCERNVPKNGSQGEEPVYPRIGGTDLLSGVAQDSDDGDRGEPVLSEEYFQPADEYWHGDPIPLYANTPTYIPPPPVQRLQRHQHQQPHRYRQPTTRVMDDNAARTRTPTPNALLLGASRPLSDILEVAAHNALDHASCMLHLRAHGLEDGQGSNAVHSASSFGSSSGSSSVGPRGCGAFGMPLGPEGSHTTFTVRTPFGKRCARDNGALGWLTHHRDEHGLAMWDSQGPWPGGIDVGGGRGVGGASKAHGMGGRGYTVKSNGNGVRLDTSGGVPMMTATATGSRPLTWFSDRTTKALVLITTTTNRKSTTDKNNCSRSRSVEQGLGEGETAGRDNSTRIAGLMASGVDAGGFGCVHGVTICGGSNRDDCGDRCCADLPWVGSVKVLDAPATMVSGDPPDTGEGSDRRRVMWLGANNNRCNIGDNDRVANYPSDDHRKGEISAPAAFPCTTCISSSTSSGSRGKRRRRPWEEVRNKLNKPSVADAHVTGQPSREGRREDYSSDIAKMPAPQAPSPRTSLGGTTRTREGGGVPCDGPGIGSVEGRDWVRKGDEHGDSRKAAVPEPTLALLRRFAVCTEVIVLRGTTAHHTNKLPVNHSPSSTASHSSSKGQKAATPAATSSESRSDSEKSTTESERHSYPGDEKVLSPGFAEARVLEGGVTVLFRHFIVVDEVDMGVLNPQDESTPPGLSGMTMDPSIRRHPIDDSSVNMGDPKGRDPSVAEITRESFSIPRSPLASAPTRHPPHFVIDSTSGSQPVGDSFSYTGGSFIGGNPSIANNVPAAEGNTSAVSNRKGQPRQPQYQPQQKHRHQEQQEQTSARSVSMALLTVREAMVVKLAAVSHHRAHSTFKNPGTGAGDTTPSRNFSGPKIHPKHERESISVVGLLAEVGFRVQGGSGDAGVAGSRRKSSPSSKAPPSSTISRPAAAAYTSTDKSRYGDQAIAAKSAVDYPGRFGGCSARVGFGNGGVLLSDATSDPARGKRGEVLGRGGKTSPRLGEGSRTSTSQQKQHLVDMFQRVAEQGLQLCLTLAQGVDKVCVYMSVSPESWPPGMIPGHAVVQVSGVSRRLSGNGKSVYLVKARAQGGAVKVLSLALPPPPAHLPVLGWSAKSTKPPPISSPSMNTSNNECSFKQATATATTRQHGATPYPHCTAPVLLFPRPRPVTEHTAFATASTSSSSDTFFEPDCMPNNAISKRLKEVSARHSATCAGGSAGSTAAAAAAVAETFQEVSLYRSDKCSAKSAESTAAAVKVAEMQCDARGVILASRDGSSVFIDTHPPYDGHLSDGIGRARASRNTVVAAEIVLPPRVLDGFGSSCSALSTVHSAGGNGVVAARGSPGGFEVPRASSSHLAGCHSHSHVPLVPPITPSPVVNPNPGTSTLASLCKRGVLVRATQRFGSLTVVGVRFVKVSVWCKNCGPIKAKNLESGRCWARCHTPTCWDMRWEGSASVDDGTAQALLLLDGDDVRRLLKLSSDHRAQIESAALQFGPVVLSERASRHIFVKSNPPGPLLSARDILEAAVKRATGTRASMIAANCVQVVKKGGTHPGVGALNGGGGQGYGSAVIGVMGDGMETLTLPKLVMQATGVEEASVRAEAYACLARLL